jgi:hypothetical protein
MRTRRESEWRGGDAEEDFVLGESPNQVRERRRTMATYLEYLSDRGGQARWEGDDGCDGDDALDPEDGEGADDETEALGFATLQPCDSAHSMYLRMSITVHLILVVSFPCIDIHKAVGNFARLRNSCVTLPWDSDRLVLSLHRLHESAAAVHASGQTAEQSSVSASTGPVHESPCTG